MSRITELKPEFVESLPEKLEEGKIYVSIKFRTGGHKCCCGCGTEIITPIRPNRWTLTYDGETVSLNPSIGNRQLKCRSHYVITNNRVHWFEDRWSEESAASWAAEAGRRRREDGKSQESGRDQGPKDQKKKEQMTFFERVKSWFQR